MYKKIVFLSTITLMLLISNTIALTNIFAQNSGNNTEKIKNGGASSGTHGPGAALQNQTSKELSNDFGNITQGVKNFFKGNS